MAFRRLAPFYVFFLGLFVLASTGSAEPRVRFKSVQNNFTVAPGEKFDLDLMTLLADIGSGNLVWSIPVNKPVWLTLDAAHPHLSGTPELAHVGVSRFTLFVQDSEKGDSTLMEIKVSAAPIWSQNEIDLGIQVEDAFWQFDLKPYVKNPVAGPISFTGKNLPGWMSLSADGMLSGTPRRANVGPYHGIEFSASGTGGSSSVTARGLVIEAGASLQLAGPQSFPIGGCKKFSVSISAAPLSDLTVLLRQDGLASGAVTFYPSPLCAEKTDRVVISAGASATDLYVKSTVEGTATLRASSPPFLPAGLPVQFTAIPVPRISLSAADRNPEVGTCLEVMAQLLDDAGNAWPAETDAVLALSASRPDVRFFANANCSAELGNVTIVSGNHFARFYVSATRAEEKTLFAASPGYTSANLALNYRAAEPSKLVIVPEKSIVKMNDCTPARVTLHDRFGNDSPALIDVNAILTTQGPVAFFYSDLACSLQVQNAAIRAATTSAVLGFSAKAAGELTLQVSSSQGLEGSSATVTVVRPPAFGWLEGNPLDFGKVAVGSWIDRSVTLKNSGGAGTLLSVGNPSAPFTLRSGSTCQSGMPMAENETCVINLRFTPDAAGVKIGSLPIGSEVGTLTLGMTGTGVLPANFRLVGNPDLDFGEVWVGQTRDLALTLENAGGEGVLQSLVINGPYFSLLPNSTCRNGLTLPEKGTCTIAIRFAPGAAGAFAGKTSIVTQSGAIEGNLRGIGKLMPQIGWIGNGLLDFGDLLVGTSKELTLTVVNRGGDGAITTIALNGTGFTLLNTSTCRNGGALAAGASCVIHVRFAPTTAGNYSGAVNLAHSTGTATAELRGRGLNPGQLIFQPPSVTFNPILVNEKTTACVTVTNVGGAPVILTDLAVNLGMDFTLTNAAGCGASPCFVGGTLTAQSSCALRPQFNPTRAGDFRDDLRVGGTTFGVGLRYGIPLMGKASPRPEPPRVNIYANGAVNYLKIASNQPVTISWASAGATDCKVSHNDFAARYQFRLGGAWTAGPWAGPDWFGLGHPGVGVAPNSDAALRDVTYYLTCNGAGGTAQTSVRVQRFGFAAGGATQIAYVLSTQEEAIACHQRIKSAVNLDPECGHGTWGTFWADGTASPWWVKPATQPGGGKWCTCFNPKTAPAGKPWAKKWGWP